MEFVILLVIILVFFALGNMIMPEPHKSNTDELFTISTKQCPPHKWKHVEIKDQDGEVVVWKLICDLCGPLKSLEDQSKADQ